MPAMRQQKRSTTKEKELKELIREFHENGIEVILDVVFNIQRKEMNRDHFLVSKDLTTTFIIC